MKWPHEMATWKTINKGLDPSERLDVVAVLSDQLPVPGSHGMHAQIFIHTERNAAL